MRNVPNMYLIGQSTYHPIGIIGEVILVTFLSLFRWIYQGSELRMRTLVIGVFVTVLNQTFATSIFITFAFATAVEAQSLAVVSYVLRAVEGTLICLLLYLGLEMNKEDYHPLCGYCHDSCNRLCLSSTISTQEDDQYVEMNDGN